MTDGSTESSEKDAEVDMATTVMAAAARGLPGAGKMIANRTCCELTHRTFSRGGSPSLFRVRSRPPPRVTGTARGTSAVD
ncbi:hypothetical protein GCM10018773_07410 [Streptomyces candidus]|nr:hypothetical protein GCM10018773_07410 [Streptomyces candidus]